MVSNSPAHSVANDLLLLPGASSAAGTARHWVRDFLDRNDVVGPICDDVVLVASELVTNALRHGVGGIVIRVSLALADQIRLAVVDSGDGHPEVQPVDLERIGGLGLRIVEHVAADWGVSKFPGGTVVWAVLQPEDGARWSVA